MAMFKIIGADGREYGPVSADTIKEWISHGRANAETKVLAEGATEWRPLSTFLEFADAFSRPSAGAPPAFTANAPANAAPRPRRCPPTSRRAITRSTSAGASDAAGNW